MREIKFRVWQNGEMQYWPELSFNANVDLNEQIAEIQEWHIIMQYTGLKDRNGKEIYEGDIVRYPDPVAIQPIKTAVVVYKYDRFIAEGFDNTYGINWEKLEVIGNIYEKR